MRIDQRHQRSEAQITAADDPDLAVAFRDMLDQPVNRVVGIGRLVNPRIVQWPDDRAVHHVQALGIVFSADVLVDANVVVLNEFGVHGGQDVSDRLALDARRRMLGVIRRAR